MTNKRLAQIEMRIEKIKGELAAIGEMRPGSLTKQYKNREERSGAYYQLSYTLDMKSRTEYIRRVCQRRSLPDCKLQAFQEAEWRMGRTRY